MKTPVSSVSEGRPHVGIHAVSRYIERVEMGNPSAQLGDPEYHRIVNKILSIVTSGRKMSTEECALFVRAAGRAASRISSDVIPGNWGDYYYDEATNVIVVVSAGGDKVMTVMVPSDLQLQTLEQIAKRPRSSTFMERVEASSVDVLRSLPAAPRCFEIVVLDGVHPNLSVFLRRPDPSGRMIIRYVEEALHVRLAHVAEDARTITINPLLELDDKLRFRNWSQSFRSRNLSEVRFEFFVRPSVAPFLVHGLLGNDMINVDREYLRHGSLLLLRIRGTAKDPRMIAAFHLKKL